MPQEIILEQGKTKVWKNENEGEPPTYGASINNGKQQIDGVSQRDAAIAHIKSLKGVTGPGDLLPWAGHMIDGARGKRLR